MNPTSFTIHLKFDIDASCERVWKALVEETASWWSRDFYTQPDTQRFIIESQLGGKMYEQGLDGNGLIWGHIIGLQKGKSLSIRGNLSHRFGGPAISFLHLELEVGETTNCALSLEESYMGAVTDKLKEDVTAGWKVIFGESLKNYVESTN